MSSSNLYHGRVRGGRAEEGKMEESRQDQTDMVALFTRVDVGVLFLYLSEPGFSGL